MAEGKKAIIVYSDWIDKFEELSDEEAGRLIKHFFRYVNDLNPVAPDRTTKLMFIDIENSLKRDLKKWEIRAERSRENGNKGGRPPKNENLEKPEETQQVILEPKKPDSVNVSVSVNDINKKLLSEIEISNVDTSLLHYAKTAKEFQRLFIQNLEEKNASTVHQQNAKFGAYVTPIRLIIENKEGTIQDLRDIFSYLSSHEGEFWKSNILSTAKLREQLPKLLMSARQEKKPKPKEDRI